MTCIFGLFRRHELSRTHDVSRAGQSFVGSSLSDSRRLIKACEAHVQYFYRTISSKNQVARFDVPMRHILLFKVLHGR